MSIRLNIGHDDAKKIAACIKDFAGNVSAVDIEEIVLKDPEAKKAKPQKKPGVTMTSREVADVLGRPHSAVFKQIAKFLCSEETDGKERGYFLTSFVCSHKNRKSYPMYEMTESACMEYRGMVAEYGGGIKCVEEGIRRFDQAIQERFHLEKKAAVSAETGGGFLMEGRSRTECGYIKELFDKFVTGPAEEKREIAELSQKYEDFYRVMMQMSLGSKESGRLEEAVFGVAIEAEMQGFIYGFKVFEKLLDQQMKVTA